MSEDGMGHGRLQQPRGGCCAGWQDDVSSEVVLPMWDAYGIACACNVMHVGLVHA